MCAIRSAHAIPTVACASDLVYPDNARRMDIGREGWLYDSGHVERYDATGPTAVPPSGGDPRRSLLRPCGSIRLVSARWEVVLRRSQRGCRIDYDVRRGNGALASEASINTELMVHSLYTARTKCAHASITAPDRPDRLRRRAQSEAGRESTAACTRPGRSHIDPAPAWDQPIVRCIHIGDAHAARPFSARYSSLRNCRNRSADRLAG